jgi:hypothetical protein
VHHANGSANPTTSTSTSTSTTTIHAVTPSTSSVTSTTVASLLPAAAQTQYGQYVGPFDAATSETKSELGALGASPTLAQATPILATYLNAVKLYNLQVHYVQWTTPMQADVQADDTQLAAYITFLQSAGTADPSNVNAWLSQLQQQTGSMQTTDNKVRLDAGLPADSVIP